MRRILAGTAVWFWSATLAAQCVAPSGQQLMTTMSGNWIYGNSAPPLFGVTQDPGPAVRCDLAASASIAVQGVSVSLWNDGQTIAGTIPTMNLLGVPGCQVEMWVLPGGSVLNAANYSVPYTRVPVSGPPPGWTLAGIGALTVAPPGQPSVATFPTPILLAAGSYAIELVLVAPYSTVPGARIHPRFADTVSTNLPNVFRDQFVQVSNTGTTNPAFTASAFNLLSPSPGPFVADLAFDYTLTGSVAYSTPYGLGCYDRKLSFFDSFVGPPNPTGAVPPAVAANPGIELTPFGTPFGNYLVQAGTGAFPLRGTPGSTTWFDVNRSGQPTHVNSVAPALTNYGDWDDANSAPYDLPFAVPVPGGSFNRISINSNGTVYCGPAAATSNPSPSGDIARLLNAPGPSFSPACFDQWPRDAFLGGLNGAGDIFCDSDGSTFVAVSWVNVREYPSLGYGTTGNSYQIVFEPTGRVTFAYGSVHVSDISTTRIGFTPGNGAPDPGQQSLAALPFLSGDGTRPATIRLDQRPRIGTSMVLRTTGIDPTAIGVWTLTSFGSIPGGFDLAATGLPGCSALITQPAFLVGFDVPLAGVAAPNLGPISAGLVGVTGFAQSVQLCNRVPAFNATNGLVSDAICIHIEAN